MTVNFIKALAVASEILSDAVSVNAVHDEARFKEVQKDFVQLTQTIGALFPADPTVATVLKVATTAVSALSWEDVNPANRQG